MVFRERSIAAFGRLWRDETAASAIEYALLAGMVVIAVVTALGGVEDGIDSLVTTITNMLQSAGSSGESGGT